MKKLNTLWSLVAIIGMGVTISTANGSKGEIILRIIGIALLGIGAYLGGWMGKQKKGESHDKERV